MDDSAPSPAQQLRTQWENPSDIFSLLLIIGGDVIQKALSHTVGYYVNLSGKVGGPKLYLTPVAFSFGWVAYAFDCLSAVFGEGRLMAEPDTQIQLINCNNGFVRENYSWLLGRLLRDHERNAQTEKRWSGATEADLDGKLPYLLSETDGVVSLKIEMFVLEKAKDKPEVGRLWLLCWIVIAVQLVFAAIPWILFGNWAIFMVTGAGTFLALVTGCLPQWATEKWSAKILPVGAKKTVALTRGNGHQYAMVIMGESGAWDLETMATARVHFSRFTRIVLAVLAAFWIVLLITVTGLTEQTWFLMLVGGLGMLQNVVIAASGLSSRELGISLNRYEKRPKITAFQYLPEARKKLRQTVWNDWSEGQAREELATEVPEPDVKSVMGALMELEKLQSRAGAALLPIFFPGNMELNTSVFVTDRDRLFWEAAYAKIKAEKHIRRGPHSTGLSEHGGF